MNREEILERSRAENKNQDVYEREVIKQGQIVSNIVISTLATIFFVLQILMDGGMNYGFYAIVFAGQTSVFWTKWIKLKRRHELAMALFYMVLVLALSAAHIYNLVTASAAL